MIAAPVILLLSMALAIVFGALMDMASNKKDKHERFKNKKSQVLSAPKSAELCNSAGKRKAG